MHAKTDGHPHDHGRAAGKSINLKTRLNRLTEFSPRLLFAFSFRIVHAFRDFSPAPKGERKKHRFRVAAMMNRLPLFVQRIRPFTGCNTFLMKLHQRDAGVKENIRWNNNNLLHGRSIFVGLPSSTFLVERRQKNNHNNMNTAAPDTLLLHNITQDVCVSVLFGVLDETFWLRMHVCVCMCLT